MKNHQFFFLISSIYLAPQVSEFIGVLNGGIFLVIALIAWRDEQ